FGPGGTLLATAGQDRTVRIWDPTAGEELGALVVQTSDEHTADATTADVLPPEPDVGPPPAKAAAAEPEPIPEPRADEPTIVDLTFGAATIITDGPLP